MRKRSIKKQLWINEEEDVLLKTKAMRAGISEADFIRQNIKGHQLREKPDERFFNVLRNLNSIANNINQIAKIANSSFNVNNYAYNENIQELMKITTELKEQYLIPVKKE